MGDSCWSDDELCRRLESDADGASDLCSRIMGSWVVVHGDSAGDPAEDSLRDDHLEAKLPRKDRRAVILDWFKIWLVVRLFEVMWRGRLQVRTMRATTSIKVRSSANVRFV